MRRPCYTVIPLGGQRSKSIDLSADGIEILAERQFAKLCCRLNKLVEQEGLGSYLENHLVHLFLGTTDRRVLRSFYERVVKPVSDVIDGEVDDLGDETLHDFFRKLPISASQLHGVMDLIDYALLTIMGYFAWPVLQLRGLANGGFISLNTSLGTDLMDLGLTRSVGNQDSKSIIKGKDILQSLSVLALSTISYDKKGTDVILRVDGEGPARQVQVYEMKVAGGDVYDVLAKFIDKESGQPRDMGINVFKRVSDDFKSFIARLNDHLPLRPLDENIIRDSFNFNRFLEGASLEDQMQRLRDLLHAGEEERERVIWTRLAGDELSKILPSKTISNLILSFLDTILILNDLDAIEEFFHTGKVYQLDLTAIENHANQAIEVEERRVPVFWKGTEVILKKGMPLLRRIDRRVVFGLEVGNSDLENPFLLTETQLIRIISSDHFRDEMETILEAYKKRRVSKLMEIGKNREREIKILSQFLTKKDCGRFYFTPRLDGTIPFENEFPQAGYNYLKHLILDRLKGGKIGLISELKRQPFKITKGIIGTGDSFFFEAMERLFKMRAMLSTSYDECVVTSRRGWKFSTPIKGETILYLLPLARPRAKARIGYENKRWIVSPSGVQVVSDEGDRLNLSQLADLAEKRQVSTLIERVQHLKLKMSEKVAHSYRQPSGIVEIPITNLLDEETGKIIHGIVIDLSRPVKDVRNIINIHGYRREWKAPIQRGSKSRVYWKSALQTLEKNGDLGTYNEMVYLADQKSKIGTFLIPIFEMLDERSKRIVCQTAKIHAEEVTRLMKTASPKEWPRNIVYKGSDGRSTWEFPLRTDVSFIFKINEFNVMAWYIDSIIHEPTKDVPLAIVDTPENRKKIRAATLSETITTRFRMADIVLGYNIADLSKEMQRAILKNQEGIILYFEALEKRARTMDLTNLENSKEAISEYWFNKDGSRLLKNRPRKPINMDALSLHLPLQVIPPNLVRGTSGMEIPIALKYYEKNDYSFIPAVIAEKDLKVFMDKHQIFFPEYAQLQEQIANLFDQPLVEEFNDFLQGIKREIKGPPAMGVKSRIRYYKEIASFIQGT